MSSTHLPVVQGGRDQAAPSDEKLPGIRHVIAVASGKGGVGKSTVSVNLALALHTAGYRVGIVDADILGPSIPAMMGAAYGQPPEAVNDKLEPEERHGVKLMSMGMMTDHDSPAILRGPMVTKYIRMFIGNVQWGRLDYLIIDLPPGTGDIQLTLAQTLPLSGSVIVTTPQDVSLNIARRGLRMFEKVRVPILGVIENMSGFTCGHCGETTDIFRSGGGKRMGEELGVPFLGSIPLDANIVIGGDTGKPLLVAQPGSRAAEAYVSLAGTLANQLDAEAGTSLEPFDWTWDTDVGAPDWLEDAAKENGKPDRPLGLRKRDARTLSVLWHDGAVHDYDVRDLRIVCPCAMCVDEMTGERTLVPDKIPKDVAPRRIVAVGLYAISVTWSDGHSSGIYTFERLRKLGDAGTGSMEV